MKLIKVYSVLIKVSSWGRNYYVKVVKEIENSLWIVIFMILNNISNVFVIFFVINKISFNCCLDILIYKEVFGGFKLIWF